MPTALLRSVLFNATRRKDGLVLHELVALLLRIDNTPFVKLQNRIRLIFSLL